MIEVDKVVSKWGSKFPEHREDIKSIGRLAFLEAKIDKKNPGAKTFIWKVVENKIIDYLRKEKRQKFKPYKPQVVYNDDKILIQEFQELLNPFQQKVFYFKYIGYSDRQIALMLRISRPLIQRCAWELRDILLRLL